MIESRYWKEELLIHARKLLETPVLSKKSTKYKANIFRSPCVEKQVTNRNFWKIDTIYDLDNEKDIKKDLRFVTNQFIHSGAIYGFRNEDRNWGGIYTCSDYERAKFIYRIPVDEIIQIFKTVGNDYATSISYIYSEDKKDYIITTS